MQIDQNVGVTFDKYKFVVCREFVRFTHFVIDLLKFGLVKLVLLWSIL